MGLCILIQKFLEMCVSSHPGHGSWDIFVLLLLILVLNYENHQKIKQSSMLLLALSTALCSLPTSVNFQSYFYQP